LFVLKIVFKNVLQKYNLFLNWQNFFSFHQKRPTFFLLLQKASRLILRQAGGCRERKSGPALSVSPAKRVSPLDPKQLFTV